MSVTPKKPPTGDAAARDYAKAWDVAGAALDAERLHQLRTLTETEAARIFAALSHSPFRYPQRHTSGLVQQQQIFSRLRRAAK